MSILETLMPRVALGREMAKVKLQQAKLYRQLVEATPAFAQDNDESEWQVLLTQKEHYSESDLKSLREQATKLYYVSPSARGVVETMVNFIIGRHSRVIATDENDKVQDYFDGWSACNNFDNAVHKDNQTIRPPKNKEFVRRVLRDGEAFVRFHEPSYDSVEEGDMRYTRISFIDPSEITDDEGTYTYGIETDPDDVEKVISYRRKYYKGNQVMYETIPAEEIMHVKILCDSNEKRGVSFLVGIAKSIVQYDSWLDDRVRLNKIRNYFNVVIKPEGVSPATFKSNFEDETKVSNTGTASKKMPKSGTAVVARGVDYEFKNLNINASDTKDDGRAIERMICKGTQLVEGVITGDYSNQNYASALVAESPMVKSIEGWQDFFEVCFKYIFSRVISDGIAATKVPPKSLLTDENDPNKKTPIDTSLDCTVNFSTLVHRDLQADTQAYMVHREMGWASDSTISGLLGYDFEKEKDKLDIEDAERAEKVAKMDGEQEFAGIKPKDKDEDKNKDKDKKEK